jgi:hypothetical protein
MKCTTNLLVSFSMGFALAVTPIGANPRPLSLTLQTRDPSTNEVVLKTEEVDPAKVGIVIIDPWNYHWCMTACKRVSAMAPRWNRALECARELGIQVMWAPTEAASMYAGTPERERAAAVPLVPVPKVRELSCAFTARVGPCACGPGIRCQLHYGLDGICSDLIIDPADLIVSGTAETYSLCKQKGITHIIYLGLHTNMCLFVRPEALKAMHNAGLNCVLARDLNDALTHYDPSVPYTPDDGTAQTDADLERAGIPTINIVEEIRKTGRWRFDVAIPTGSRQINLTVVDNGQRSVLNLADWVEAGFVLKK